ncbi:MAG TPA: hypothetical protein VE868_07865 [Balneolaceae bacterium]|nr:hypothetical protein [Balneolaceae bacterium]
MFGKSEFIGLALEGDYLHVAHIKKRGKAIQVVKLEQHELAEPVGNTSGRQNGRGQQENVREKETAMGNGQDDVFGFSESEGQDSGGKSNNGDKSFEEMEAEVKDSELESLDMVDESTGGEARSNSILLYDVLMDVDQKNVNLGLNIPAGDTIFQIMRDTDYKNVKSADLKEELESKLESIYGQSISPDHYDYDIRDDGSLILASVEDEAPLLKVANETREVYSGKMSISSIYPDEVALTGLLKANYELEESEITALIQFKPYTCRIVFLKGEEILQVMPIINQGTRDTAFLNKIFSKLLFQLDTGKIPRLDQIIIADNSSGWEALDFFRQQYPDTEVQLFKFDDDLFDFGTYKQETLQLYTSAIATAWAAAGMGEETLPELSFIPNYIYERQKIFKLRWHGMLLLILIFLSIPTINYFYKVKASKISSLSSQLDRTSQRIKQLEPIVKETNKISHNLTLLTTKLELLDSLSAGSKAWSTKLALLNKGMKQISHSWFTSFSATNKGSLIKGYTLYRNRIPAIVDLFTDASLLSVNSEKIRGARIYQFSLIVRKFVQDTTAYSPEKPESIKQILNK